MRCGARVALQHTPHHRSLYLLSSPSRMAPTCNNCAVRCSHPARCSDLTSCDPHTRRSRKQALWRPSHAGPPVQPIVAPCARVAGGSLPPAHLRQMVAGSYPPPPISSISTRAHTTRLYLYHASESPSAPPPGGGGAFWQSLRKGDRIFFTAAIAVKARNGAREARGMRWSGRQLGAVRVSQATARRCARRDRLPARPRRDDGRGATDAVRALNSTGDAALRSLGSTAGKSEA